jgi:hypothetical protein
LNLKCLFGHEFQPISGLWWEYKYRTYTYFPPDLIGIDIFKLYKCKKCNKLYKEYIEYYSKSQGYTYGFNLDMVENDLKLRGIQHITKFYDDE